MMLTQAHPFARHLGRPVRRFSAFDAYRLQLALPLSGVELVPPRGPGRPIKTAQTSPEGGQAQRSTPEGMRLGHAVSAPVLVGGASNTSQTAQK